MVSRHAVVFLLCLLLSLSSATSTSYELETYIVHVHRPPPDHLGGHRDWHHSFLEYGNVHRSRLVYSYTHAFSGFAARLTSEELKAMRSKQGFIHAYRNQIDTIDTTHTPSFLGLHREAGGFWSNAGFGKGVIIGVLDTGISPLHPSFNDEGMPPPPSKWKGRCEFQLATLCNNKLIGARNFNLSQQGGETESPYDHDGHGTHTAGTAAGRFVANASVLGSARGIAAGMAPDAHLAVYKVCHDGCSHADVVAGIEQAVEDGVDVISMSLGSLTRTPLHTSPISIAQYGAVKRGVFVSASAGNRGPNRITLKNVSPWVLTVGASTMDRRIRAVVKLGDGSELEGQSAYQPAGFPSTLLPLVYPASTGDPNASYCSNRTSLEAFGVTGKIVLCEDGVITLVEKSEIVKEAGGAAMIVANHRSRGYETRSEPNMLPASHVSYADGLAIKGYINSTSNPTATINFLGTEIGGGDAPAVAAFSSRGPSPVTPGVLKPDIIGPGVNVLAAWPTAVGPFEVTPAFNIISGTSMACPHLSGIAALVKGVHPNWSPAMIKSAIMTTADITNLRGEPILDLHQNKEASFYEMGAGSVNPLRAANPGLVYDIQEADYVRYLCSIGYTDDQVNVVINSKVNCSEHGAAGGTDLNYPSIEVELSGSNDTRQVNRMATNVGDANSTYGLSVERPHGVTVEVGVDSMSFSELGQKVGYTLRFGVNATEAAGWTGRWFSEGHLSWVSSDGKFTVRSPISVTAGTFSGIAAEPSALTLD